MACRLANKAGAEFVKTSTGFTAIATAPDVAVMRRTVAPETGVKAAGGIRTSADAQHSIVAGANGLGASAAILQAAQV